jgi:chromosome segregation ATPase
MPCLPLRLLLGLAAMVAAWALPAAPPAPAPPAASQAANASRATLESLDPELVKLAKEEWKLRKDLAAKFEQLSTTAYLAELNKSTIAGNRADYERHKQYYEQCLKAKQEAEQKQDEKTAQAAGALAELYGRYMAQNVEMVIVLEQRKGKARLDAACAQVRTLEKQIAALQNGRLPKRTWLLPDELVAIWQLYGLVPKPGAPAAKKPQS